MRSILLVGVILLQCQVTLAQDETAPEMSSTAEVHQDLDGKVFHWGYSNLGGGPASFRVLIKNEKLHFEGVAGVVKGAMGTNTPQFSKIDQGVYFITWQASHGIESLVINLSSMKVNGHLQFGDSLSAIDGDITCNGLVEECEAPKLKATE